MNNTSNRRAVFQVEPVGFIANEQGQLREVPVDQLSRSAAGMLRFSPRQFELRPGESQTVRLGLRKPAGLAPGEYGVHLRVRQLPAAQAPVAPDAEGEARFVVPISLARAVRVTVRHNVSAGTAEVLDLKARRSGSDVAVTATFVRSGSGSSSGEYAIVVPGSSEPLVKSGIRLFTETSRRVVEHQVPLASLGGANTICLVYSEEMLREPARYCTAISGL